MRKHSIALVLVAAVSLLGVPATAAPLFFDDFSQEQKATNTQLDNWTIARGTVDVVGDPDFFAGLCTGGPSPSHCVDLDGSTSSAARIESTGIALGPGSYQFSFWLRGNARNSSTDTVRMIVETGVTPGESFVLGGNAPWTEYIRFFSLQAPQVVNLVFDHAGGDNIGILLDNVRLEQVPEPALLALLGFGLAGACARRRRS